MLSVSKSTFVATILAALLAAGFSDGAHARQCVGCNVPIAQTYVKTVYRTQVVYHHRTVTRVRNVVRENYVVRPQPRHVVRTHAPAPRHWHWDNRPSRHHVWPGSSARRLSCGSLR
jgi:hypothetical protein